VREQGVAAGRDPKGVEELACWCGAVAKWLSLLEDICEKNISMLLSAAVEAWRAQPHESNKTRAM
jgi:hypothetical protein